MGNRALFFGLLFVLSTATACRNTTQLVPYFECMEGYPPQECTSANHCKGTQTCGEDGMWGPCIVPPGTPLTCEPPTPPECDENAPMTMDPPTCYTGPASTRFTLPCHPGFKICQKGKYVCAFEQTPTARNCTNGVDNDCDGTIDTDQRTNLDKTADVVLFIDESGSMVPYFDVIKQAIIEFAQTNATSSNQVRIALIGMPHQTDGQCGVISHFVDPMSAASVVDGLNISSSYFGQEPTIDCPYLAAEPRNSLGLQYRPGVKRTFVSFTDEEAQSYVTPRLFASAAGHMMASQNIQFFSFDRQSVRNSYFPMTNLTGGKSFELQRSYSEIQQDLVNLFHQIVCTN